MSTPTPEVVQTLELSANWHPLAVQRLINFFEARGQLVSASTLERKITVRFVDDTQAKAFALALEMGRFPKGRQAMF